MPTLYLKWTKVDDVDEKMHSEILQAVEKALNWCVCHTAKDGSGAVVSFRCVMRAR